MAGLLRRLCIQPAPCPIIAHPRIICGGKLPSQFQRDAACRLATEYQTVKDDSCVKKKRTRISAIKRLKATDAAVRSIFAAEELARAAKLKRLKEARLKKEGKTLRRDQKPTGGEAQESASRSTIRESAGSARDHP